MSIVLDGVLGPLRQHATPDGVLLTLQFQKQRTRQVEAIDGRRVSSKSPSNTGTRELPGTTDNSIS